MAGLIRYDVLECSFIWWRSVRHGVCVYPRWDTWKVRSGCINIAILVLSAAY